jgi:FMN phosphatase YigB (HAD superfamily)
MPGDIVLLFDVMDTLVYDPFNLEIPAFFGLSQPALLAEEVPHVWEDFELGRISEQEYFEWCFRDGRLFDHEAFRGIVREAYRWLDPKIPGLLTRLREVGYEMHALSNYPVWYETIEQRLKLSDYLPWSFVSCRTGVRKPAADAYLGVISRLGRPAGDFLFIDDRPANCHAARAVGMDAIHFTAIECLHADLVSRGILADTADS